MGLSLPAESATTSTEGYACSGATPEKEDVALRMKDLVGVLYNEIPSGVGSKGKIRLGPEDEKKVLRKGARWAVEQGFGSASDLERIESGG